MKPEQIVGEVRPIRSDREATVAVSCDHVLEDRAGLCQHEIAVLGRQLQLLGPDPSLAQAYRIEWQTPRLRYVKHLNNVTDSESLRYIQICLAWLKMCFHPGYTIP